MRGAYSHRRMLPEPSPRRRLTHFISHSPFPPPSHRSATPMTARLVLRAASRRMAAAGLFLEEGMSNAPNCLGRPPPSAAICRSRSCRWLGADARYALPVSDQVLTTSLLCHPRFPGAGFVTPARPYIVPRGKGMMLFRRRPRFL